METLLSFKSNDRQNRITADHVLYNNSSNSLFCSYDGISYYNSAIYRVGNTFYLYLFSTESDTAKGEILINDTWYGTQNYYIDYITSGETLYTPFKGSQSVKNGYLCCAVLEDVLNLTEVVANIPMFDNLTDLGNYITTPFSPTEQIITAAGGGATHVAKVTGHLSTLSNNLSDILVVAAGGGGSAVRIVNNVETDKAKGGHGGGYVGGNPFLNDVEVPNKGGTQSSGYDFGQGQEKDSSTGGGGAGLYGGKNQDNEWGFQYTGEIQTFTAPRTGIYQLETWGAQGGNAEDSENELVARGGYGAYAVGEVLLTQGDTLYIGVGGQNGYNGGGNYVPPNNE